MPWLKFLSPLFFLSVSITATNSHMAFQPKGFSFYKSGANSHHSEKPTARHKNHCAYVVEKSVSYTVQKGAAPYVKAEYKKCGLGKKCPGLRYRMFYKPMFKVEHKTMTALEWRCCPGFTGVGCNYGPTPYGMKAMPPFKGHMPSYKGPMPSHKGTQPASKGPMSSYKGPMPPFKGPMPALKGHIPAYNRPLNTYEKRVPFNKGPMPPFHGTMSHSKFNRNPWNQPLTPSNGMDEYPGPNAAPSYPESSFETYQEPETDHPDNVLEDHNPDSDDQDSGMDHISEYQEPVTNYQHPRTAHHQAIPHPETKPGPEIQAFSGDSEPNQAVDANHVRVERLNQMEEDVKRLSLGLETLRAKVTGLEDHLRASLREDANHMISTLLSAVPAPIAAASQDMTVGFGDLPGGAPDLEGSDAVGQFPNLGELAEKVAKLHAEVLAKSTDLVELKRTVLDHEGALQRLSSGPVNFTDSQQALEALLETKFSKVGGAVLGEFDKRVETAEQRCEERVMEIQLQCKKQLTDGQEQLEQAINGSVTAIKMELATIHADLRGVEPEDACCVAMSGMTERLVLLEQSMGGLNQSQGHLQAVLGGHKDHVEGMIEGRLAYVESLLNTTEKQQGSSGGRTARIIPGDCLDEKVKDLEFRLFAAIAEVSNATSPVLFEGLTLPTLDTEVKSFKNRVEVDLDLIQEQIKSLELVCSSSCAPQAVLTGYATPVKNAEEKETRANLTGQLNAQTERLDHLNGTLNALLMHLTEKEDKELQSEVTLLKVSMHSVNHTLCGLKDSFGQVVQQVGQTNLTWQEREERLAQQVKGVVQLIGRQASMLGAGERRLTRLKSELQNLRRRLASELETCHSTALGVQKEVTDVGGRVSRVEGQCGGLSQLAEDLEVIRGELEKHSDGYLSQVNSTLVSHSLQLSELRDGIKNCTKTTALSGDQFTAGTQQWEKQHTIEAPKPRGDQFIDPTEV